MRAGLFLNISIIFLSIYSSKAQSNTADGHYGPKDQDIFDNIVSGRVFDSKVALRVPNEIAVMVKRWDNPDGAFFVDHVSVDSYRDVETWGSDYVRMKSGAIDFTVNVNYCDCRTICASGPNPRWATSFKLGYDLTFDVNNGYVHFKTAVNSVQVAGNGNSGFATMFDRLVDNERGRYVFGPFRMPNITTDAAGSSPVQQLFEPLALKEWAMFEMSEERSRKYVWDYEDRKWSETELADQRVSVNVYNYYTYVSFDRSECFELDRSQPLPYIIELDRGDCLRVYEGKKCTGPSRTTVENNRVGLMSDDWTGAPRFDRAKSIAYCWRSGIPLDWVSSTYPATEYRPDSDRKLTEHSQCHCPCNDSADVKTTTTTTTTTATPGSTTTTTGPLPSSTVQGTMVSGDAAVKSLIAEDLHRPITKNTHPSGRGFKYVWQWGVCLRINRFALTLTRMAKMMSVKVATATSDDERMLAAKNALDYRGYMMLLSNETVTLVRSISENNFEGIRVARFFAFLLKAEIKRNRTSSITLETASTITMDTALEMLTEQAFIDEVCEGIRQSYSSVPVKQLVEPTGSENSEQVPNDVSENTVDEDDELRGAA